MTRATGTLIKFTAFALVMAILTAFLFFIFSQTTNRLDERIFGGLHRRLATQNGGYRAGRGNSGRHRRRRCRCSRTARCSSSSTRVADIVLTTGTKAQIRYLNLTGDRFLELADSPGSTKILPVGSQIPVDRTAPALDLDLLLGGLKPVIQGLNPQDVNALTSSLIQILQGQGGTLESLFSKTSSFSNSLADNSQVIEQMIDDLRTLLDTLSKDGDQFSGAIDRLERLVSGLSTDRDPIGEAITSLDNGTASLADLLGRARPPLAGTIDELSRLAPLLDGKHKDYFDATLQQLPELYRKLARVGSYGAFFPYYICGITFRASDLEGRTVVFPWIKQETGRCAEN